MRAIQHLTEHGARVSREPGGRATRRWTGTNRYVPGDNHVAAQGDPAIGTYSKKPGQVTSLSDNYVLFQ